MGQKLKKNAQYIFYSHIFISWKKALNIFSIFCTHHRIPNKHMMTINFDTITNNYEVIYNVIKTDEILLKKNRYEFSSASYKYGSTFICWRHRWRDLVYEYSWAKSPMISGYAVHSYRVPGKFIRRLKTLFVGWKVYSSTTNKAKFIRIAYLYSKCTDCRIKYLNMLTSFINEWVVG